MFDREGLSPADGIIHAVPLSGELSATEYRNFWISWKNKTISVGRGKV